MENAALCTDWVCSSAESVLCVATAPGYVRSTEDVDQTLGVLPGYLAGDRVIIRFKYGEVPQIAGTIHRDNFDSSAAVNLHGGVKVLGATEVVDSLRVESDVQFAGDLDVGGRLEVKESSGDD